MGWQGWDSKGPNLRQEPTPEPAPPSFHKPTSKKREKPWTVEVKFPAWMSRRRKGEWGVLGRYATREARDQALAKFLRVDQREGWAEYRAGPDPIQ